MLSFFVLSVLGCSLVQAKIDIVIEDATCEYINEEYVTKCELEVIEEGLETALSFETEIIKTFSKDFRVKGSLKRFNMGEAMDIGFNAEEAVCYSIKHSQTVTAALMKEINFSPDDCPPPPGVYGHKHIALGDQENLPDSYPTGRYLMTVEVMDDEITYAMGNVYLRVL